MPKPKNPAPAAHKYPNWAMRLPPIYKQQMELAAKKHRRFLSEEAKIAFETYLAAEGLWPVKPDDSAKS